jgi:hypothetical protein
VDFMRMHDDGTLTAWADDLRPGLRVNVGDVGDVGDVVIVGSEDSVPARARVVRLDISGLIIVSVLDVAGKHGDRQP